MSDDQHEFGSASLSARVLAQGAELCRLQHGGGRDYLWPAGEVWPRHAPVLFPIVGRLRDDTLVHNGRSYHLTQHGFARDRRFEWVERTASGCRLVLRDDAATRALYPFRFRFELRYAAAGETLTAEYLITNTGDAVLPASMGAHPAFRWPLEPGRPKADYALTFEADEPAPLRGVAGGLLTPADRPSPIDGRRLALNEDLFAADALILEQPASRQVRFAAADGPSVTVGWDGFEQLGIWMRQGGDFLCIEPWHGMASPADFDGDFVTKPWLMLIPPGESRSATYRVTLRAR
ncbi:MAG: aldose 1-epimerase family protein [Proteobacteria bacterium]|nr:aldose 1-epimerase family protein [Pseudomonadota bacterium]